MKTAIGPLVLILVITSITTAQKTQRGTVRRKPPTAVTPQPAASAADPTPTPKATICIEKQRLMEAFFAALKSVMKLQQDEAAALVRGDPGLEPFDLALVSARARRDEAKRLYIQHVVEHHC